MFILRARRRFSRVYLYLLEEFLLSFLVAFLFFFFIFFINQLLVMAEEIFAKKVPFWDVIRFVIYSLPSIIALAFPFGSLVGCLMAVGRLSSDNEILAFKAAGVPLIRILTPLLVMGLLLSLVSFVTNDYFLPLGNIRLGRMYRQILYSNPGVELEPYSVRRFENITLITGAVHERTIENMVIIDKNADNQNRIIRARRAFLTESRAQRGVVSFRLEDVSTHVPATAGQDRYEYTTSGSMIYNILLKNINISLINPGPREKSSLDVWREIRAMEGRLEEKQESQLAAVAEAWQNVRARMRQARDFSEGGRISLKSWQDIADGFDLYRKQNLKIVRDRNLQLYRLEFYKKFSVPFSCVFFVLFAFPVGLFARKSGRSVGFGLGLLMSAVYWGLLFTGHNLGIRLELSPFLAMWFPNLFVLALGIAALAARLRR
jgi:lipopolysaccharide export system permease protein